MNDPDRLPCPLLSETCNYSAMKSMPIFSHKKAPDDAGAFGTLIFAQIT
jgi:hypothetical protein